MMKGGVISDQLFNWSDNNEGTFDCISEEATKGACEATAIATRHSAGISHRAVQTVWQARLQVCAGSWPWSQALLVGERCRQHAEDGLCSCRLQGSSGRASQQLLSSPGDPGRDLRDQLRAVASPSKAIADPDKDGHLPRRGDESRYRDGVRSLGKHDSSAIGLRRPRQSQGGGVT